MPGETEIDFKIPVIELHNGRRNEMHVLSKDIQSLLHDAGLPALPARPSGWPPEKKSFPSGCLPASGGVMPKVRLWQFLFDGGANSDSP
jgi:hypothetical protein